MILIILFPIAYCYEECKNENKCLRNSNIPYYNNCFFFVSSTLSKSFPLVSSTKITIKNKMHIQLIEKMIKQTSRPMVSHRAGNDFVAIKASRLIATNPNDNPNGLTFAVICSAMQIGVSD